MSDEESDEELYSIASSQAVYKRSRSRSATDRRTLPKLIVSGTAEEDRRPTENYVPVTKWAVDYNNKNYIRSQCNKNIGLHRKLRGRPLDWHVEYDNHYHVRSQVNAPKGLHRLKRDVKRKYAPDNDDLADATGWEFDCGPEIDQEEQDVPFIPEGRIISRGCYRWYGVKRNDSDCDLKQEEHRENLLNEELEEELKCGHEFFQSDIPHMSERLDKKYSRGGYRFYEVPRNVYDIKQEELATAGTDPEWRRKHHTNGVKYLETEMTDYDLLEGSDHHIIKGKPFKRTILNKVYELRKREDSRESTARHATRLSLVPGEGERTLYQGVPDRFPFGAKKKPSIRNIFKKKSERKRYKSIDGEDYEEYEREDTERNYRELSPEYQDRLHRMADERRQSRYVEDEPRRRSTTSGRFQEYAYGVEAEDDLRSRDTRSASMARESPRDVREEFETWRDNAENTRRQWEMDAHRSTSNSRPIERRRTEAYKEEYSPRSKVESGSNRPRSTSLNSGSPRDVREEFETWRENVADSRREWEMDPYRKRERRPTENRRPDDDDNYIPRSESSNRNRMEREGSEYRIEGSRSRERKGGNFYEDRRPTGVVIEKSRKDNTDYDDRRSYGGKDANNRGRRGDDFVEGNPGKDKVLKKLPPHVEKRMREIEEKMERKFELVDKRLKGDREGLREGRSIDGIDLVKHKGHPGDRGHSHSSEYEKYVTKNGSEYWVKKEEKFSELHHKNSR